MVPTNQDTGAELSLRLIIGDPMRVPSRQTLSGNTPAPMICLYDGHTLIERTDVDVRIGVTQAPRELTLELADDIDREALKTKIEGALSGAVDVLWLTDRRNRDIGVSAAKIAYVEIGTPEGDRKIGFGG